MNDVHDKMTGWQNDKNDNVDDKIDNVINKMKGGDDNDQNDNDNADVDGLAQSTSSNFTDKNLIDDDDKIMIR